MSITTPEQTSRIEVINKDTIAKRIKKLRDLALKRTIEMHNTPDLSVLPATDRTRFEEIQSLPAEEIDRALASITAMADDWQHDTGDIPVILTNEVRATANAMIENWEPEDYTTQAVLSLGRAYDITQDSAILDKTLEVVHELPNAVGILPAISVALEQAAESDQSFSEAYSKARYRMHADLSAPKENKKVTYTEKESIDVVAFNPADWEWLYDKNASPKSM